MPKNIESLVNSSPKVKAFNFDIETLRGIAAIAVVWGHATVANGWIDPDYSPTGIWAYVAPGHLCVLVFFLLSGYVIGLAHKSPLNSQTILLYLKKRFVRIYPIYFVSLLLALLVAQQSYSAATIAAQLTVTQGILSPVVREISPAWSLAYEVVFYLLFVPISYFRINAAWVMALAFLLGCINVFFYPIYGWPLFSSFAFGATFWLCGLLIARYVPDTQDAPSSSLMARG